MRVRVRKTSTLVFDLPNLGCSPGQLDLASWISDSRKIATSFSFYDSDPNQGANAIGSVNATKGVVNSGQYLIVNIPAQTTITYYATAGNNTGCQNTASDVVVGTEIPLLDPVTSVTASAGNMVQVSFTSPNATNLIWYNTNNPDIGIMGPVGMGNLIFTAQNATSSPLVSTIRVVPYINNCAGTSQDFTITVNPGSTPRLARNSMLINAFLLNANDIQVDWDISYEFPLDFIEVEKMQPDETWKSLKSVAWSSDMQTYSYIHQNGKSEHNKYRLKLVHTDGRVIWSQVVEVTTELSGDNSFTLYPNPSNGRFRLSASTLLQDQWDYHLVDQMGRTILAGSLEASETSFDIRDQAEGCYYLILMSSEGKRFVHKMIKQ
jgi:hypothetical protein